MTASTPTPGRGELEADEFICAVCGVVAREHPKDGMGECPDCVEAAEQ